MYRRFKLCHTGLCAVVRYSRNSRRCTAYYTDAFSCFFTQNMKIKVFSAEFCRNVYCSVHQLCRNRKFRLCSVCLLYTSRVFANIITNAVKYKGNSPGALIISGEITPHGALITVADNGKGIAESDLEHMFDSLYRGDSSRNAKIGGNGLGLSICRKIIEDHGGKIWKMCIRDSPEP